MMIKYTQILFFVFLSFTGFSQPASKAQMIAHALLCVPEPARAEATVYGYDEKGQFVTLRKGSNEMICIADDPKQQGFSVASYHLSLEPFMARGRVLKSEGMGFQEIFDIREKEVTDGELIMPEKALLTVMTGEYDQKGEVINLYTRYVFYIPFATSETTGLPTAPVGPASPWIMDPGTHRAHIMINPPRN